VANFVIWLMVTDVRKQCNVIHMTHSTFLETNLPSLGLDRCKTPTNHLADIDKTKQNYNQEQHKKIYKKTNKKPLT